MDKIKIEKLPTTLYLFVNLLIVFFCAYSAIVIFQIVSFFMYSSSTTSALIALMQQAIHIRLLESVLVVMILYYFNKILSFIKAENFFNKTNVDYLRKLSIIAIFGGIIISLIHLLTVLFLLTIDSYDSHLMGIFFVIKWKTVFLGLIILLIAHAFKAGENLQTEQNLTI